MPFGIKSAPAIFQRKMHELIEVLNGVEVIADDFVFAGYGDSLQAASKAHKEEAVMEAVMDIRSGYEQIEKELLAIVFACEKFDACIYGRDSIRVQTDHKPLDTIFRKTVRSAKASSENALEVAEVRFGCNLPKRRDVDC